jgi:hypothetical protein
LGGGQGEEHGGYHITSTSHIIDLTHGLTPRWDSHKLFKLASRQAIGHASETRICDAVQCCDIPSCTRRIACRRLSHTRHERTRGSGRHPFAVNSKTLLFWNVRMCVCVCCAYDSRGHTENTVVVTSAPPRNLYLNERFPANRHAMLVRVFQLARPRWVCRWGETGGQKAAHNIQTPVGSTL